MTFIEQIDHIDRLATLAVNSFHCGFGDFVWKVFSNIEIWYVFYLAVAFFLIRNLGWKRGLVALMAAVLVVVSCDQLSNLVQNSVERLRPCNDPMMLENGLHVLEEGGLYGFFSAHAANVFGFAACTSICFRKDRKRRYGVYTAAVFVWAALVSMSRIFVGKHYLGDVLTGTLVGLLIGSVIAAGACMIIERINPITKHNA